MRTGVRRTREGEGPPTPKLPRGRGAVWWEVYGREVRSVQMRVSNHRPHLDRKIIAFVRFYRLYSVLICLCGTLELLGMDSCAKRDMCPTDKTTPIVYRKTPTNHAHRVDKNHTHRLDRATSSEAPPPRGRWGGGAVGRGAAAMKRLPGPVHSRRASTSASVNRPRAPKGRRRSDRGRSRPRGWGKTLIPHFLVAFHRFFFPCAKLMYCPTTPFSK